MIIRRIYTGLIGLILMVNAALLPVCAEAVFSEEASAGTATTENQGTPWTVLSADEYEKHVLGAYQEAQTQMLPALLDSKRYASVQFLQLLQETEGVMDLVRISQEMLGFVMTEEEYLKVLLDLIEIIQTEDTELLAQYDILKTAVSAEKELTDLVSSQTGIKGRDIPAAAFLSESQDLSWFGDVQLDTKEEIVFACMTLETYQRVSRFLRQTASRTDAENLKNAAEKAGCMLDGSLSLKLECLKEHRTFEIQAETPILYAALKDSEAYQAEDWVQSILAEKAKSSADNAVFDPDIHSVFGEITHLLMLADITDAFLGAAAEEAEQVQSHPDMAGVRVLIPMIQISTQLRMESEKRMFTLSSRYPDAKEWFVKTFWNGSEQAMQQYFDRQTAFFDELKGLLERLFASGNPYEAYLNEVILPEKGYASRDRIGVIYTQKEDAVRASGGEGLLSLKIADFNGDGLDEMITLSVEFVDEKETVLGQLMGYNRESLCLRADLYGNADGSIRRLDSLVLAGQLVNDSWGVLAAGIRKADGVYYLYGVSTNRDATTYGPSPFGIYHVEGDSFVFDSLKGWIGWGQASWSTYPDRDLNLPGLDISQTVLMPIYQALEDMDVGNSKETEANQKKALEKAGASLMSFIRVGYPKDNQRNADYQAFDYTLFSAEKDEAGWTSTQADQPEEESDVYVDPDTGKRQHARQLTEEIEAKTGLSIPYYTEMISGDLFYLFYQTEKETRIRWAYREDGSLAQVMIYTPTASVTEEWIKIKDAALNLSELGMDAETIQAFSGECSLSQNRVSGDGKCQLSTFSSSQATLIMQWGE